MSVDVLDAGASPVAIGLLGATGRMGRAIAALIAEGTAAAVLPPAPDRARDGDALTQWARAAQVLIDFSVPDALARHLNAAVATRTPIVIGTTGLDERDHAAIDAAARTIPVLQAANTSLGVALLGALVELAAARLGPDGWDIEILDMHHRAKRDHPSGTALWLADKAAAGRAQAGNPARHVHGHPPMSPRASGTIGIAALRGGSVIGDHQVIFAGAGERIELGHRADDRALFARGALRAALWLIGRPPGRYAMADVLELGDAG